MGPGGKSINQPSIRGQDGLPRHHFRLVRARQIKKWSLSPVSNQRHKIDKLDKEDLVCELAGNDIRLNFRIKNHFLSPNSVPGKPHFNNDGRTTKLVLNVRLQSSNTSSAVVPLTLIRQEVRPDASHFVSAK